MSAPTVPELRAVAERARRLGSGVFSERLAEGWYPSAPRDDEGHVAHDRHVLIWARQFEATLAEIANLLDRLVGV